MWRALALKLPDMVRDLVGMGGAALVSYGAWLIYQPAGYIVGGLMLIAGVAASAIGREGPRS